MAIKKLNDRHKKVCQNIVLGKLSKIECWKSVYPTASTRTADKRIHELQNNPLAIEYMNMLRIESDAATVASLRECKEYLTDVIRDASNNLGKPMAPTSPADGTKAVVEMSKLEGWNKPEEVKVENTYVIKRV